MKKQCTSQKTKPICHPESGEGITKVVQSINMKLAHQYFVYIIQCNDGFYYIGVTNDLDRRIHEHNQGANEKCFTFKRRPVTLKYYEHFTDVSQAIRYEKQLKGWSRAKKEALIENNIERLKELSKSKSVDPSPGSG